MLTRYKISLEKSTPVHYIIIGLLLLIAGGIFAIPIIDKEAAYYASEALHIFTRSGYSSFTNHTAAYFSEPHFLYWTEALSMKFFGINTFAYRLPLLVFSVISVASVYKLAKHVTDVTTAKLAALILATAQGFIFSIVDARTEAPITAAVAFGLWQFVVYTDTKKTGSLILAAAAMAVSFSSGSWAGALLIFITGFIKSVLQKKRDVFFTLKTALLVPLFGVMISPLLYTYFYTSADATVLPAATQPNTPGVASLLWNHITERVTGAEKHTLNQFKNPFSLVLNFLWAFAPWSIAAYAGAFYWLRRNMIKKKKHAVDFLAFSFAVFIILLSFFSFRMQQNLLLLLPLAALFTAPYLRLALSTKAVRFFYPVQLLMGYLVIAVVVLMNFYLFKPVNDLIALLGIALLITLFILLTFKDPNRAAKVVYVSLLLSIAFNFFMTYNFFPNLVQYQKERKITTKKEMDQAFNKTDNILFLRTAITE